jgi:D-apionolactonase
LRGAVPQRRQASPNPKLTFSIGEVPSVPLPRLGLGMASHGQPLSQKEIDYLKMLNLFHLRVDLKLSSPAWPSLLREATIEAEALDVDLEMAVFLTDNAAAELRGLISELGRANAPVCTWLIFHEGERSVSEKWIQLARAILGACNPSAKIGSGTDAYFYQLNQYRPPVGALDLVSYSVHPQEHTFDNKSLAETLEVQGETVRSARRFIGQLPLAISPITLKPRFNPNATGPLTEPGPDELPSQVDVRQMSLFGAGWTLGSLKYLSEIGVESLTYYETTGWRGVVEKETGSPLPAKFHSLPGAVFPLFHVLADAGDFAGGVVLPASSSDPLKVNGLVLGKAERRRILLANLTAERLPVEVNGLGESVWLRDLNENNVEFAMASPLDYRGRHGSRIQTTRGILEIMLLPFALARLDEGER